MKVLLIGSLGYIGSEFKCLLDKLGCSYSVVNSKEYSYRFWKERIKKFDLVINAAGFTGKPNVDAAELKKSDAILSNVLFPELLAQACESTQIPLLHVSSGCIYDGYSKDFSELDYPNFDFTTNTCSFYSGTKALAELRLKEYERVYVARLRIPFDCHPSKRNYLTKLLSYEVLLNCRNSLSHREDFAISAYLLAEGAFPYGTYNITNPGSVTTSEVCELIKKYGVSDKHFEFFESLDSFNTLVKAPRSNCVLDTTKLESLIYIRTVQEALERSLEEYPSIGR